MKLQLHATKPYVIAEIGTSCDASAGNIVQLALHCVAAGASAIKLQHHAHQRVSAGASHPAWFQGPVHLESRESYIQRQCAPMQALRRHGPQCPIIVSPFCVEGVKSLCPDSGVGWNAPDAWKIASGQVTNHELIRACVATGLPIIVSSGMTTQAELNKLLDPSLIPCRQLWCVMDCTSEYPCVPEHVHVEDHPNYCESLHGFSDHSPPGVSAAAIVALTRGARVFERHVTFDQRQYGSDAKYASTIDQFARYCEELEYAARIPTEDIRDENAERLKTTREQFLVRAS